MISQILRKIRRYLGAGRNNSKDARHMALQEKTIIDDFHNLYYNGLEGQGPIFQRTYWMKVPCLKCPLDIAILNENGIRVAGAPPPSLVLANFCPLIK